MLRLSKEHELTKFQSWNMLMEVNVARGRKIVKKFKVSTKTSLLRRGLNL
jgi:hypothetical protein